MRQINKPNLPADKVLGICLRKIRSSSERTEYQSIERHVAEAERRFESYAKLCKLTDMSNTCIPLASRTLPNMAYLYDRHLARKASGGREIYNKLLSLPAHQACPYCGHRTVSTLDHFLPKASFPLLAITPINLVACCMDCNHKKGDGFPSSAKELFFNPYYEALPQGTWLHASIIQKQPVGIVYSAIPPASWDETVRNRIIYQFDKLELAKLYAPQAARELANIKKALTIIHNARGPDGVCEELRFRGASAKDFDPNSWQTAFYEAASQSDWFLTNGFL